MQILRKISLLAILMLALGISAMAQITVSGSTGANASYTTLSAAFTQINASAQTGNTISIAVTGDTAEPAAGAILNAGTWTSLTISPSGGAARTISGAANAGIPLIDFNGADNVTVNGLNTGGDSLTISNTTVSATSGTSTIRFIGGATGNTITNSNIQGSGTMSVATNGATIFFSTDALTANGNDSNTISNNNISSAGANLPTKGILCNGSTGTTAIGNSGLNITNNNIFDYFGAAVTSSGIAVNGGCNTFSITNNRLYQTGTRTWVTGSAHRGIDLNSSTGTSGVQGMIVTGNIIGYASNTQTGVYTLTGAGTGAKFVGIVHNGISTGTTSNVNNNTVAAVSLTGVTGSGTSTASPFIGILLTEGNLISNGNTVGSQSATGSLTFSTTTTTATDIYGIYNFSSNVWTSNTNNIGGISVTNLGASGTFLVYGMRAFTAGTATWTANSNNVGGEIANSIQLTGTGTASQVVGMFTSNCPLLLTSNTIRNLTTNIGTGTTTSASVIGINTSAAVNHTLSQNTIHSLTNTNATAASVVTGIQFTGSTANIVERNFVHSLTAATNSTAAEVNGIRVAGGTTQYRNNMIALGAGIANALGAAATNGGTTGINGFNGALGTDTFVHNSIYIGGSPTAGTGASYALNGTQTVNTRSFRDNIFFNARSNSGATGSNYAVKINGTAPNPAGLTINNNVYFANGTGGVFGFFNSVNVANIAAWRIAVGQDAASFESNPQYLDPTNAIPDLHIHPTNATVVEGNGADVGVTLDFDGQTRASFTPTDIGADAGNFNGVDLSAPNITYTPFGNTSLISNRLLSVMITDVTGVATGGLAPRIYFNKNGGTYFSTACSLASGTVNNGIWNCTIDNTALGGVVATDVIRYFVVAQDTLGNLASNPGAGFSGTDVNTITTVPTNPNSYTIVAAFTGSFNVGTGETYTSLTNTGGIFEAINAGALTGNVVINLTSNLTGELGTVSLNQFAEDGAGAGTYTILIKPSGAPRTITGTNAGALIKLNGADRVRIDGSTAASFADNVVGGTPALRELTIQNTNTGASAVVISIQTGTNGAQNNRIQNVNVLGQDPTSTLIGIAIGGNTPGTTGADNDGNRVINCTVRRAIFGIYSAGASAANPNTGTFIQENDLSATTTDRIRRAGIIVFNEDGIQINENSVGGINNTGESADVIGIGVGTQGVDNTSTTSGGVVNAVVNRNRINGVSNDTTFSAAGIAVAGGTTGANTISNNMITGVISDGTSPDFPVGIWVAGVTGSTTRLYYNSISMTGDRSALLTPGIGQQPSYGIAITGTNPAVELKNNIFYTTQTAEIVANPGAKSYAIGLVSTTFGALDSNYNAFYSTGAQDGGFRTGSLGSAAGTDYATLALWSAAVADDANSQEGDPLFTNPLNDLHISLMSVVVYDKGTPVSVLEDFDGQIRSVVGLYAGVPDIGADEALATTAANASISGSVTTAGGEGIRNATVMLSGGTLTQPVTLKTGAFGKYQFDNLPSGQTYVVTVIAKRYTFGNPSRVISLEENVGDADFISEPNQ